MAIVKMKRVFLAALKSDRETLISELMKLSCVELSSPEESLYGEELLAQLPQGEKASGNLEDKLKNLASAIEALERYDTSKKPLFPQQKSIAAAEIKSKLPAAEAVVPQVAEYILQLSELKNEENHLEAKAVMLEPYRKLEFDLAEESTAKTNILVGTIPVDWSELTLQEAIISADVELVLQIFDTDKENNYVFGLYPKDREEESQALLKTIGFQKAVFRDIKGTAQENLTELNLQLTEIAEKRQSIEKELTNLTSVLPDLKATYDYFAVELQKQKQSEELLYSEEAFFVECWIPEKKAEKLEKLLQQFSCSFEIRDPLEGEEPPVLLQNSKLVEPFESITELYSLPAYDGIDPNSFVAFFYAAIFGLMLGDAAYGAILAIASFILTFKFKLEGTIGKLVRALGICGLASVFWGVVFGSYFGDLIQVAGKAFFGLEIGDLAFWFNTMEDPMKMLIFCFILGVLHLFAGMALKGFMLIRDGKPWDALFDVGFWYLFLIGLVLLFLMPGLGKWLAIAGAVGLILTQGRQHKNPIKRFFSGLLSLYGVINYVSDVLSYSRILALGLSTAVIASVFNIIGSLGGPSILGIIIFLIVFVLSTALNLFLGALGAFVHTARLHFIEFFGQFYVPGGRPFSPFKAKTKFIKITNEEA